MKYPTVEELFRFCLQKSCIQLSIILKVHLSYMSKVLVLQIGPFQTVSVEIKYVELLDYDK